MPGRKRKHPSRSPLAIRLGATIRDTRMAKHLSQEMLAESASLSKNYIGNIERGEYDVTVSALHRVAKGLGCRAADLLAAAEI
jgi:transcriptional regulator with XRE-family HTH domain